MAIYLTGDIHGELSVSKLSHRHWPEGKDLTRNDYVIILGDFGLIWAETESGSERYWLNWLDEKSWTTLVVDGNHENFDRLNNTKEFPVIDWKGGKVQHIRDNVLHLMRGEIYDIDGISVLSFGGAESHDKPYRVEGKSWWPQEEPNIDERGHCVENLIAHGDKVDLVLTHEAPAGAFYSCLAGSVDYSPSSLSFWLQSNIAEAVKFDRWYFGHHHIDRPNAYPFTPLFDDIVKYEPVEKMTDEDYNAIFGKLD